ncbi:MAG: glycyl-radical enzyme activating protein, partial [Lentisphaeria bacterium]|nr:glycyl-radical enzyme activating protein [Lentisphaeria bacterium]
ADLRRLTLHDGPGIRDTVFLKGCTLHCRWCHNPECISASPQLLFRRNLCLNCGACAAACPNGAHRIAGGVHSFDRSHCDTCGRCADACLAGAVTLCGRRVTAERILAEVVKDRDFFAQSGGGVTLSGGEPLRYPDFAAELFRLLRDHGISTALDTCGNVDFAAFERVLPFTDLILYDVKGMDPERHRANVGHDNVLILNNLKRLGGLRVPLEIRMPVVPGCNDGEGEFAAAGRFFAGLPMVERIRLLAYHDMARDKYRMCGMTDTMPETAPPTAAELARLAEIVRENSRKVVVC